MPLFFGSKRSQSPEYGALIDIRSGSVGVGIVESKNGEPLPRIVAQSRIPLQFTHIPDKEAYFAALRGSLVQIETFFLKTGKAHLLERAPRGSVASLLVSCSAPWAQTVTRRISYSRKEPFRITKDLLIDLVEKAEEAVDKQVQETTVAQKIGFDIGTRAIMQTQINGYPVRRPLGHKGLQLHLSHVTNLVASGVTNTIYNIAAKIFPHALGNLYAYLFVLTTVLCDIRPDLASFCIIDISGEATEIALVESGTTSYVTNIPYGAETLVRTLHETLQMPREETLGHLRAFNERTLVESEQKRIGGAVETYKTAFTKVATSLYENNFIPQTAIIASSSGVGEVLAEQVQTVLAEISNETHELIALEDLLEKAFGFLQEDTPIATLALFFHREHRLGGDLVQVVLNNKNRIS